MGRGSGGPVGDPGAPGSLDVDDRHGVSVSSGLGRRLLRDEAKDGQCLCGSVSRGLTPSKDPGERRGWGGGWSEPAEGRRTQRIIENIGPPLRDRDQETTLLKPRKGRRVVVERGVGSLSRKGDSGEGS